MTTKRAPSQQHPPIRIHRDSYVILKRLAAEGHRSIVAQLDLVIAEADKKG